jgi:hypothetical protein
VSRLAKQREDSLTSLEDIKMKNVTLWICLLVLGLAPLHAQCKLASTGIAAVTGGYSVTLPPQVRSAVPTSAPLRLVLRNAAGQVSSVAGPAQFLSTGQLWIQTSQRFAFSSQQCPTKAVLQGASLSEDDCLGAEFGIGCFLSWCGGQAYCLPGYDGGPDDGFSCVCL